MVTVCETMVGVHARPFRQIYHATTASAVESILATGLFPQEPRHQTATWWMLTSNRADAEPHALRKPLGGNAYLDRLRERREARRLRDSAIGELLTVSPIPSATPASAAPAGIGASSKPVTFVTPYSIPQSGASESGGGTFQEPVPWRRG
jgi:hypothetical protein